MITIMETKKIVNNKELVDIACLSTDTKPTTGIMNGSMLIETDTGKVCIYNEEDGEWTEIGSGGGGGGSSDFTTVEVTITNSTGSGISQSCIAIQEFMGVEGMTSQLAPLAPNSSVTVDMVLFKGTQVIYPPDDFTIAVTGDITDDTYDNGEIIITGAGSITYSAK